jgi:DNA-binding MarR family transcriptional regulator
VEGQLDFTSLKKRLNATDGALGMHLQKLQEAGYITVSRSFVNRRPKSTYAITVAGRKALIQYLQAMQRLADELGISR